MAGKGFFHELGNPSFLNSTLRGNRLTMKTGNHF
jgi:hypothetical protein